jgi:hypothetical protein
MSIKLLGKRYGVDVESDAVEKEFYDEVLSDWTDARLRNPNMARFGDQNGKRRAESRTEVPNPEEPNDPVIEADSDEGDGVVVGLRGLDEAADNAEELAANLLVPGGNDDSVDDCADIEPFSVPGGSVLVTDCPELSVRDFKKTGEFAYKFPKGWNTATFRGAYKGRDQSLKGSYDLYFQMFQSFKRKVSVQLLAEEYGLGKCWVMFKAQPRVNPRR